ncbi:helix-turn-helix domain-containing protein [Lysinibacillus capsici]|uniref:helix-turn-helix domain-containing protein n=1 Tax=Lysinibacillus capsici TaxID=2115968 RepID=UPI0029DE74DD|nr:helix-turn-helix transcriptional regulator [Lysinibacillus capsici]MEC1305491.1 helix-turn-helix transcriptional regulator [Lysinibacillus capsici]WPK07411.1 helix-turn-helix transcriptional regulator [Lysinibacillus capsici]
MNSNLDIHERIKYLREKVLKLKQSEMSLKIGLKQGSLSDIERRKTKTVTDRIIKDISREFNISENWLRTGKGEMFITSDTFSLDEQAKKNNLTDLEIAIMRSYMNLDREIREKLMDELEMIFKISNETAATTEEKSIDAEIEAELEAYRKELEAEKKGKTLSALPKSKRKESS